MIDEMIDLAHQWSSEQDVDWKSYILLHGLKGFVQMSDEEIKTEYNTTKEEIK